MSSAFQAKIPQKEGDKWAIWWVPSSPRNRPNIPKMVRFPAISRYLGRKIRNIQPSKILTSGHLAVQRQDFYKNLEYLFCPKIAVFAGKKPLIVNICAHIAVSPFFRGFKGLFFAEMGLFCFCLKMVLSALSFGQVCLWRDARQSPVSYL